IVAEPHVLHFSEEADAALQDFERWLEPQLAEGEDLSLLAGWTNKLAGAVARIAGVFSVVEAVTIGEGWHRPIKDTTVNAAITLGRDYFVPHAQAAFALMGADEGLADAKAVWASVCRHMGSEYSEDNESATRTLSRRDIHQANRRRFP